MSLVEYFRLLAFIRSLNVDLLAVSTRIVMNRPPSSAPPTANGRLRERPPSIQLLPLNGAGRELPPTPISVAATDEAADGDSRSQDVVWLARLLKFLLLLTGYTYKHDLDDKKASCWRPLRPLQIAALVAGIVWWSICEWKGAEDDMWSCCYL